VNIAQLTIYLLCYNPKNAKGIVEMSYLMLGGGGLPAFIFGPFNDL